MRIAVTGGRGRLGSYVVAELARDHAVRVIDRAAPATGAGDPAVDVLDAPGLAAALAGQEVAVHLAAIDRSVPAPPDLMFEINVRGTWNLFSAAVAAGLRRVVLCSSISAYGIDGSKPDGAPQYLPIDERHPLRPSDTYGLSKAMQEEIAAAFARRGLEVLVLRPSFVAFPEMLGFLAGRPSPVAAGADGIVRDEPLPHLRSYVGPEDAARAFRAAVELSYGGHDCFLVTADDSFVEAPTLDWLGARHVPLPPLRRPERFAATPRAAAFDNDHARRVLGWQPTTDWLTLRHCSGTSG